MKNSHNRLVTKIFYDYNNFMHYRGVRFGGKLDYHYKETLSDINKKIIINYPLNYSTIKIYELGKRKTYITRDTTSFELHDVKDYQDMINKLIKFYKKYRNNQRSLTNLEYVNESKYKNPKRKGVYPDNYLVLEYYEDDDF